MEKLVKIADAPGYARDMKSGAVVLNNTEALNKYQAEKRKRLEELKKMTALYSEIESIRQTVDELRTLIHDLKKNCQVEEKE